MSPEEYMARMEMKKNAPQEESIINIASPEAVTKESFMAKAPDYTTSFMQQPKPEPSALQQAGAWAGESALGKMGNAGWDRGSQMFSDKVVAPMKTWWGGLGKPVAVAGNPHIAAKMGAETMASQAAAPGVMGKLAAAGSGAGSGMMAGLGALGPIGLGLGGIMLAKRFGLFNKGGAVGPLSPQYHAEGDEVEDPMARPRYLMYPYQSNIETPMAKPRPMTYGEAYDKAYGKYGFDHMEPESEWGKSLYHGFNKALSPSIALDAKIMQWMHNKEMRDAGVPGFNQGGNVQHKEHGGMTMPPGPLSNNKSVKMEKKETIEYKN